jgi:hypothetical protein
MTFFLISGGLGSGKTALATYLAMIDARQLFANYKVNVDRWHLATPASIDRIDGPSLVIIDEIYAWVNARISGSDVNQYMAELLLQSRKRSLDIVGTLQLTRTLDVIFREMTDYLIMCKRLDDGFGYTVINVPKEKIVRKFKIGDELAKQIYPFYDTYERIHSLHRYRFMESDPREYNDLIDEIVQLYRVSGKQQKKEYIKDFLLKNSYPKKMADDVYNRLLSV